MMKLASALALAFVAGCSHHTPAPTDGSEATETTIPTPPTDSGTAAATSAPPAGDGLAGAWTSPSCSKRTYPREITFDSNGIWSARDLVSPCPPNAKCVWSGIVDRSGKSKLEGTKVLLIPNEGSERSQAGSPFPTEMSFDAGVLSEPSDDGGSCHYKRS